MDGLSRQTADSDCSETRMPSSICMEGPSSDPSDGSTRVVFSQVLAIGEDAERVPGYGAVMGGSRYGIPQGAMAFHQLDPMGEIALVLLEVLERAAPEAALFDAAAPIGEHHRQRDLALAEIIADGLAELRLARRVIQHVVDQLEGDAEIEAIAFERLLLDLGPLRHHRADAAGGREQGRRLAADDLEIGLFAGLGVVAGDELQDLALRDHR